ncbi:putative ribonuclease H-like domain-containing protein [Tanacetum coccineum]
MMTQKLGNGFEFIKKACFVCGSFNHLIKDCDFHDKKMVEKQVLNNKGKVTGQRGIRPVWNNAQRVNHQNKYTHPHPKRNFVPTAVVTKSGQVPVNTAKQSSPRATTSISTARPVNTVAPKSKVNDALLQTYSYFKAHSPVRRAFNQKSAAKTNNLNEKVKTARVNNVTTAGPKAVVSAAVGNGENAVKSSACWIWRPTGNVIDHTSKDSGSYMFKRFDYGNPQYTLQDQGIFDSGCSRHMTGNKSFLTDYQEVDDGFVAFAGSPKGGKITRKGKIKTGKLDFEDVYFVKELKLNLFSVSQMCDKKNIVLFTKTKCLVLSPNFKLLDESQVFLKVPKQNNMYSFNLTNVVPSGGLTCLFAKATIDESNLWHRRLGHKNFKTMNKHVRGKLVIGLPSKLFENDHTCIACQKRKQHKASCKTKLVSSIRQPLQMLHIALFGPTSVRSINHKTYCLVVIDDYSRCDNGTEFKNNDMNQLYGMKGIKRKFSVARTPQQNGVVERNNRTLIEAARTMLADSLLPTTFWAEAVSIACYVQNKVLVTKPHNKTPYELLHGSGPDWLFDIDLLTNSMNYEPVTARYQTNKNAVADDAGKKTNEEPANEGERNGEKKVRGASNKEDDQNVHDFRAELDNLLVQQKEGYANSTNRDSTVSPFISAAGQSFTNAEDLPTDPLMPDLEDTGIFNGVYDDEDVGAEADLNNLETTMNVSPIPTTRIHKDHPKDQIIGDINSATQTRRMTKISKEHDMIEAMQDELLKFRLEKVWRLVDLPKGKHAIRTKWVYKNKKDDRGILVRNKARLVAQEKALYGLHQAPRAWYETLSTYLLENGYRRGTIDKICSSRRTEDKYVVDILKKFDFVTVKTTSTPIETNKALLKDEEAKDVDVHLYRSMIGSLMYLTASRPDIMFAVCACARFQVTPKVSHLHAMKRIFRYLKGQHKLGLWYSRDSPFDLEAFSDSDYAGASLNKKSTTGDETVYKEWEDIMERAATTASSLEAEQDSGSGPRCKDTILGGAKAKIRFEAASKQSNDRPFSRVNTFGSGEDNMKLKELMELCTKLSERILDIKTDRVNWLNLLLPVLVYAARHSLTAVRHKLMLSGITSYCWKPKESNGFEEIIDFLNASYVHYALMVNPTIYTTCIEQFWASAKAKIVNGERQIQALVDKKKVIIIETSIRNDLKLDDAEGIDCLPTATIFAELERMGAKTTAWNEFSSTMAYAIIFFLDKQVEGMARHKKVYVTPSHTKKVFANMKRSGKSFSGRVTPLFPTMMIQASEDMGEDSTPPSDSHSTPIISQPLSSKPQKKKSRRKLMKGSGPTEPITTKAYVSTPSYDPPQSGEDSMQLSKLMNLCTSLQEKVLNLEKAKEIASLKKRVKQLEKRRMLRTPRIKRLRKNGSTSRGRKIEDLDADAEVTLVDETQEMNDDNLMFDTGVLEEQEKEVCEKEVSVVDPVTTAGEVVTTANVEATTANVPTTTIDELTLAQTLIEIKAAKPKTVTYDATTSTTTRPKARGVVVQEPNKGKAIMVKPERPLKKKDQVALDEEMARNLEAQMQAELIEEERLARQQEEEANIALIESWNNTQDMMEADFELS